MTMTTRIATFVLLFGVLVATAAAQTATPWTTGTYVYDGSGNIKSIGTDQYVYDRFGRVTSGTAGPGHSSSYTYDRFGNMLSQTLDGTTVQLGANATTNRLTNTTTASGQPAYYGTYDSAGRMTGLADGSTFTYDGLGMMTSSSGTPDGKKKIYIYTAGDERIAAVEVVAGVESRSEWTLRDTSGKVLRRYDKTRNGSTWQKTWRQDYIYAGTQLLASEIDTAPRTLHFFADHLGTPRLITGNGGMKVSSHTYFPFGAEASSVVSQTGSTSPEYNRLKFTGHERDTSALDYMHARYYGAGVGRFLSVDPSMDLKNILPTPQRWNRYSYVSNNPVNKIDPDGREENFYMEKLFREQQMVGDGKMTEEAYWTRRKGEGVGTLLGVGIALAPKAAMFLAVRYPSAFSWFMEAGAAATGSAVVGRQISGEFMHQVATSKGNIGILAYATTQGTTLTLKDAAVYPMAAGKLTNQLGTKGMLAVVKQLGVQLKELGYTKLIVQGVRVTGANPGKESQIILDLTRLR